MDNAAREDYSSAGKPQNPQTPQARKRTSRGTNSRQARPSRGRRQNSNPNAAAKQQRNSSASAYLGDDIPPQLESREYAGTQTSSQSGVWSRPHANPIPPGWSERGNARAETESESEADFGTTVDGETDDSSSLSEPAYPGKPPGGGSQEIPHYRPEAAVTQHAQYGNGSSMPFQQQQQQQYQQYQHYQQQQYANMMMQNMGYGKLAQRQQHEFQMNLQAFYAQYGFYNMAYNMVPAYPGMYQSHMLPHGQQQRPDMARSSSTGKTRKSDKGKSASHGHPSSQVHGSNNNESRSDNRGNRSRSLSSPLAKTDGLHDIDSSPNHGRQRRQDQPQQDGKQHNVYNSQLLQQQFAYPPYGYSLPVPPYGVIPTSGPSAKGGNRKPKQQQQLPVSSIPEYSQDEEPSNLREIPTTESTVPTLDINDTQIPSEVKENEVNIKSNFIDRQSDQDNLNRSRSSNSSTQINNTQRSEHRSAPTIDQLSLSESKESSTNCSNNNHHQPNDDLNSNEIRNQSLHAKAEDIPSNDSQTNDPIGITTGGNKNNDKPVTSEADQSPTSSSATDGTNADDLPIETGYVKFFSGEKGYGFIIADNSDFDEELFVHYSTIYSENPFRSLTEGERVEFQIVQGPKGFQAINVTGPNGSYVEGDPEADIKFKMSQYSFNNPMHPSSTPNQIPSGVPPRPNNIPHAQQGQHQQMPFMNPAFAAAYSAAVAAAAASGMPLNAMLPGMQPHSMMQSQQQQQQLNQQQQQQLMEQSYNGNGNGNSGRRISSNQHHTGRSVNQPQRSSQGSQRHHQKHHQRPQHQQVVEPTDSGLGSSSIDRERISQSQSFHDLSKQDVPSTQKRSRSDQLPLDKAQG